MLERRIVKAIRAKFNLGEQGQAAMVVIAGLLLVLTVIPAVVVNQVVAQAPLMSRSELASQAEVAARTGISNFEYYLNNPQYPVSSDPALVSSLPTSSECESGSQGNWEPTGNSAGQVSSSFEYYLDSSEVKPGVGGPEYLFSLGRAGTSGHYVCRELKAMFLMHSSTWTSPGPGGPYPVVVPPGTQEVEVIAEGGAGAQVGSGGVGGAGGGVRALFPISSLFPGATNNQPDYLYVDAGGAAPGSGSNEDQGGASPYAPGGEGGDLASGGPLGDSGGGGGASAVCLDSTCSTPLVVAGGGGGGGDESIYTGGNGGSGGISAPGSFLFLGGNGTPGGGLFSEGGAGGSGGTSPPPSAGGNGSANDECWLNWLGVHEYDGGGGGGGGYGGGQGGQPGSWIKSSVLCDAGGGGGGGSSYVNQGMNPTVQEGVVNPTGNGYVELWFIGQSSSPRGLPTACGQSDNVQVPYPGYAMITVAGGQGAGIGNGGADGTGGEVRAVISTPPSGSIYVGIGCAAPGSGSNEDYGGASPYAPGGNGGDLAAGTPGDSGGGGGASAVCLDSTCSTPLVVAGGGGGGGDESAWGGGYGGAGGLSDNSPGVFQGSSGQSVTLGGVGGSGGTSPPPPGGNGGPSNGCWSNSWPFDTTNYDGGGGGGGGYGGGQGGGAGNHDLCTGGGGGGGGSSYVNPSYAVAVAPANPNNGDGFVHITAWSANLSWSGPIIAPTEVGSTNWS